MALCLSSAFLSCEHAVINNHLKIAVISGGQSAEAGVSRVSAAGVTDALLSNYPKTKNFELDASLTKNLQEFQPDVVFPVLHGPPGEDGTLQGYLEILGYQYVGSDVHASAVAMDKVVAKHVFAEEGLPLAKQVVVHKQEDLNQSIEKVKTLGTSVVVKPSTQGSALGVTRVEDEKELREALALAFEFDHQLLVEERILGKEITVGVLQTADGAKALPVIEIVTGADAWYDFDHRYTEGLSEHLVPAPLTNAQTIRLQDIAVRAHLALGCRDLSRADFVVPSDDHEVLLEVNTLPGMTPTSLYPDAANVMGLNFEALVSLLVEQAASR